MGYKDYLRKTKVLAEKAKLEIVDPNIERREESLHRFLSMSDEEKIEYFSGLAERFDRIVENNPDDLRAKAIHQDLHEKTAKMQACYDAGLPLDNLLQRKGYDNE